MLANTVIYLDDDDFVGPERTLHNLRPEANHAVVTAYMVIYRDRVLKNRMGRGGEIGQPSA